MASMNNWLAFSLSPQELPSSQSHQSHSPSATVSHLISGATDDVSATCYGLSAADSASDPPMGIPALRPDTPFGILEAFHRPHHQTPDWNKSELSMLVGSSSNQSNMQEDEPKLEDFLGGNHSFSDQDQKVLPAALAGAYSGSSAEDYMFSNSSFQVQDTSMLTSNDHGALMSSAANGGSSANNSIGLSMIKTWLRNQPIPQQQGNGGGNDMAGSSTAMVANVIGSFTNSQSLSLSMSTGSQSSSGLPLMAAVGMSGGGESSSSDNKQKGVGSSLDAQTGAIEAVSRKPVDTFGQRTSIYRGVTRHRWTGRYEAHLWDNSCRREGQTRKGRQGIHIYIYSGYDKEDKAARAYDLAALKYWGPTTTTNFPISNYEKELEEMKHMTRQEFVASLRRKSSGFSRGASIYRGVTRHHQHGRWQARIGRVAGNKDLYLGTFSTQEEAAEAYDIAAIKFRGLNAVTNFDMSRYDVKSILESNTLPIGGAAKRLKDVTEHAEASVNGRRTDLVVVDEHHHHHHLSSQFDGGYGAHQGWPTIAFHQQPQSLGIHYPPYAAAPRGGWCKQEQDAAVVAAAAAAHGLQDLHQLHLGSTTNTQYNFFQPQQPPSVLHNQLVSIDHSSATSLEHSTGSNSVMYNGGMAGGGGGYQGHGFMMPMSSTVVSHLDQGSCSAFVDNEGKPMAAYDPINAYNYISHQHNLSSSGDQAQAIAGSRPASGGHGAAPLFTVWNDA
ncbi:AP2-like ethylene-responsive transcription factor BBM2 [Canna indica]|uniref:AP2-like ethylene-responsive transcription factor BBM2 n=1 Tax=Canna indica TaxID=4628 RepID=A0AAQ3KAJ2_9LILI|nr:AP2-like ethylene-responsive transcription factor BBM2 [Canna indica]